MTQEVRVLLQLTLDVDVKLSREKIEKIVNDTILSEFSMDEVNNSNPIQLMMIDIIEIREEAEIYGNEE